MLERIGYFRKLVNSSLMLRALEIETQKENGPKTLI